MQKSFGSARPKAPPKRSPPVRQKKLAGDKALFLLGHCLVQPCRLRLGYMPPRTFQGAYCLPPAPFVYSYAPFEAVRSRREQYPYHRMQSSRWKVKDVAAFDSCSRPHVLYLAAVKRVKQLRLLESFARRRALRPFSGNDHPRLLFPAGTPHIQGTSHGLGEPARKACCWRLYI